MHIFASPAAVLPVQIHQCCFRMNNTRQSKFGKANYMYMARQKTHVEFGLANQAIPGKNKEIFLFSTLVSHWLTPSISSFPAQIQNV